MLQQRDSTIYEYTAPYFARIYVSKSDSQPGQRIDSLKKLPREDEVKILFSGFDTCQKVISFLLAAEGF